eukprot:TRINITY_DN510_c0_g1_i1.p1 TRINITY_DN510_c0_g1~~TRINITY_DN510_c0_g1_i1.p1  ORF type:complete len:220 (-),score=51.31 TRINITY_DN510_c0_g1_i1:15-674(-)
MLCGTLEYILQNDFIREHYYVSDTNGGTFGSYGNVIFTKLRPTTFYSITFPSSMGRLGVFSEYTLNSRKVVIATVHLESLDSTNVRKQQLELVADVFKDETSILMGDFNFDAKTNYHTNRNYLENDNLGIVFPDHYDFWDELYPDNDGITFDSVNNLNCDQGDKSTRYDRMMVSKSTDFWSLGDICILGTGPIEGVENDENEPVWISDHYGLLGVINMK